MNQEQKPSVPDEPTERHEIQQGAGGHGAAKDEGLKRIVRQHPQRDEPKVDSVEPGETPPP